MENCIIYLLSCYVFFKADTKGKKQTRTIRLKTRSLMTLGGIARDRDVKFSPDDVNASNVPDWMDYRTNQSKTDFDRSTSSLSYLLH